MASKDGSGGAGPHYVRMQTGSPSLRHSGSGRSSFADCDDRLVFEELPKASVIDCKRSERHEFRQYQLVYTVEIEYRQFKWRLIRKASQVLFLHFALKKRALFEDLHEKQEQVREWLQSLGLGEHSSAAAGLPDDDEHEESHPSASARRDVPSRAALPLFRPSLGRTPAVSTRAIQAMQDYLNHFLGNLEILNTREVCKFLEVSRLSFLPEYGPKLREGYVAVSHLPEIHPTETVSSNQSSCKWICCCCNETWQKVWAVLKPGFLALLADPFDLKPLDIIVFDVLVPSDGKTDGQIILAKPAKERNPLRFSFDVVCGTRVVRIRTKKESVGRDWVAAINDAGLRPPEGWCHPHRYGSFAPPRGIFADGSEAQWFIDGNSAFNAIATAIEGAKSEIFIAGWWLCPDLYLRRPFHAHRDSRLDSLLEAKARAGVQIYVLVYKEVALALKINSVYTKRRLLNIHENIKVLRFPDHFTSGVYLWSHHEKIIVVDHQVCFLGGLDLCFGRYDTPKHMVCDDPAFIWPGKDYYNPRESEPNSWEDVMKDELDRKSIPRMPWHDVQCAIWGPACRDVARHFVQRWNYAKMSKARNESAIPLLLPHHHMVLPHYKPSDGEKKSMMPENELDQVETVKIITSPQSSYEDLPLLFHHQDDGHGEEDEHNGILMRSSNRDVFNSENPGVPSTASKNSSNLLSSSTASPKSRSSSSELQMKDFVNGDPEEDNVKLLSQQSSTLLNLSEQEWWESQEREGQLASGDDTGQVGPRVQCSIQVLRSVGQWSAGTTKVEESSTYVAYCSLISKAEHFIYIENQFFISGFDGDEIIQNRVLQALYDRILWAHKNQRCFRVIIVLPLLPGFQGGVDDAGAATVRAIMHWQYRTICRGRFSLMQRLHDAIGAEAENYVSFYGLRNYGRLVEGGAYVTSQIYVHSKVMIIDDRAILVGSANINDRSFLGSRDSEVAIVLEDDEFVDSLMNSIPWKAGKLAHSLRKALWIEHLGLKYSETSLVIDPISNATYKDLWMKRAQENTIIYEAVFNCVPTDSIRSRVAFRLAMTRQKEKFGHTTLDLGVANEDLSSVHDIKGHLVNFPFQFMSEEDLRPVFRESEYYASSQVFH